MVCGRRLCAAAVTVCVVFPIVSCLSDMSLFKLRQAINVPGIRVLGKVVNNPSLAVPCIDVPNLEFVNVHKLRDSGIKCLVFDKDNTLWYGSIPR